MKKVKVSDNFFLSNNSEIKFILGPCQIESREHTLDICDEIDKLSKKLDFKFIFKSSYDKANRSSLKSKRGIGLIKGLDILSEVKQKFDCPVTTDVHDSSQCIKVKEHIDVIQIPAFLCRQTDLLIEAGKTNLPVNIKKGQFLAPWEILNVTKKILSTGNKKLLLTERGTMFGYNNLVSDMRSLPIMKKTGFPVIFDATHSVQQPGGMGDKSGGQREHIPSLSKAAISIGVAGLFLETHNDPDNAPSDGPNMINIKHLKNLLIQLKQFDDIAKNNA